MSKRKAKGKAPDRPTNNRTTQDFKPCVKLLKQSNNNKIHLNTQKARICWRQEIG